MTETLVQDRTLTAEEFYDRYAGKDGRIELVEGEVIEMPPAGPEHGGIGSNLHVLLAPFVREHRLGRVYLNTGFILRRNPDEVRGPDEAFVSAERIAASPPPTRGFWEIAPDLAVEIVSPDDTAAELAEKVEDYLRAGVRLVWVVYPRQRQVYVYRQEGPVEIIPGDGTLDGGEVLPGLRLSLAELWS